MSMKEPIKLIVVFIFLCSTSCSSGKYCTESGYTEGWNYDARINVNGKDEGHSQLYNVKDCFANGKHLMFYPNGVIMSSGEMVSGKFIGKEFQYDSLGYLDRIIYHNEDSTFIVKENQKIKGKKSLH